MDLSPEQKYETLKYLLEKCDDELVFWRNRNWSATKAVIGAFVAMAGVAFFQQAALAYVFVVFALAVVTTLYFVKNHKGYQKNLDVRTAVRRALGLFDKGAFCEDPILDPSFSSAKPALLGTGSFVVAVWVTAVASVVAMVYAWKFPSGLPQ